MARAKDSTDSACLHCGAPNLPGASYCCTGCEVASELLSAQGLDNYYCLLESARLPSASIRPTGEPPPLTWLAPLLADSPAIDGVQRLKLDVQNTQCAACVWVIEQLFHKLEGGLFIEVNSGLGKIEMVYKVNVFSLEEFLKEIAQLGYRTGPPRKATEMAGDDLMLRFGIVVAIAMNSMIFSFSTYFGLSFEGDPLLFQLFGWANWALSTVAVWVGGQVFVKGSILAMKRGILHLDVPVALGVVLAYVGSSISFFMTGGSAAYFDTLTVFIALMLLGRMLQRRVAEKNRRLLLDDGGIDGLFVRRIGEDDAISVVAAAEIQVGDQLSLAQGEICPVDCRLESEGGSLALDWMNGEPEPRSFGHGDDVPAGARNVGGQSLRLMAQQPFQVSRLRDLLTPRRSLSDGDELALSRFWDRISRVYVALVLSLGTLGMVLWWDAGPEKSLEVVVAVLVVTCPCALGLATPLAYELALGALRRRGFFVTRVAFLDRALDIKKVIFDKTGTLTMGDLKLKNEGVLQSLPTKELNVLGTLCAQSNHPRSRALFQEIMGLGGQVRAEEAVTEEPGRGLSIASGYKLGSPAFALGIGEASQKQTIFSLNGASIAAFEFEELLHLDASLEVKNLLAQGLKVFLFSGDEPARVARAAKILGIPDDHAKGGLSPEDKARLVEEIDEGDTLMVGDGVNDALAFDAAFAAGTPAIDRPTLPARADFFMMTRGAPPIAEALSVSRHTRKVILRNLYLAVFYNVITVGLALGGIMTPLICAIAMPLSSLFILLTTARAMEARKVLPYGATP